MQILCYGCRRSMGNNAVEPTSDIRVWYGLHDEQGCGQLPMMSEMFYFSDYVERQNRLPWNPSDAARVLAAPAPSVQGASSPALPSM